MTTLALGTENFYTGDQSWLASQHATNTARSCTLDISEFDATLHYPNGYLPSGLVLGVVTATGLYGPYTSDAATQTPADGLETAVGILFVSVATDGTNDPLGAYLWTGAVVETKLPIQAAGDTSFVTGTGMGGVDTAGKTDLGDLFKWF